MNDGSETPDQAFTQLYRETRGEVLAYLLRRSRTREDATDALAETYAAAWRKLESLPTGDGARLWLFGAARNELRMTERQARTHDRLVAEITDGLRTAGANPALPHDRKSPLSEALHDLSAVDYEIVTLNAWEGLAPREIASVLGLSANVVRIRLHRARGKLRRLLQEVEPERRTTPTDSIAESAQG